MTLYSVYFSSVSDMDVSSGGKSHRTLSSHLGELQRLKETIQDTL